MITLQFQCIRTAQNSTKLENELVGFTQSTLIMSVPSMFIVTKKQPVGGGQCSKRDWTAQLISTAAGMTTNEALEIWMVSSGSDWTRFTACQKNEAGFMLILKTRLEKQLTLNTTFLVLQVREVNTSWVLEHIRVSCIIIKFVLREHWSSLINNSSFQQHWSYIRTMFTPTIIFSLPMKWLLGSNLSN